MPGGKLLMLINFFPPSGGGGVYRPLSFVKYLSRMSWRITVVTPKPGEFWITDPGLEDRIPDGVRVVRTGSLSGHRILGVVKGGRGAGGSRRSSSRFERIRRIGELVLVPDTYVGWVPFAVRAARRLCRGERFDIVYSTSPPDSTHLAAARITRSFSIPWVADFRDPWISLCLRDPPTALHRAIHRRMERRTAGASRVIVTTTRQKERIETLYPACRVEKIPNGYDEDDFAGLDNVAPPERPFTMLHGGMLTLGRTSRNFLEGLSLFLDENPEAADEVRVVFLGARESDNEEWVRKLGLDDAVSFADNVPHARCIEMERSSHVLLLIKHDDERYRGLVPGKLFEYIGARRPILALVPEGEASRIVTGLRRGEVAGVSDPASIARKIHTMFELYRQGRLDGSYSLEKAARCTRRSAAERFNEVLTSILEER